MVAMAMDVRPRNEMRQAVEQFEGREVKRLATVQIGRGER